MLENFQFLAERAKAHENLALHLSYGTLILELRSDDAACYARIDAQGVTLSEQSPGQPVDIVLRASAANWAEQRKPAAGREFQALSTMRRRGHLEVSGDMLAFNQNLLMLEMLFTPAGRDVPGEAAATAPGHVEDVVGRYVHVDLHGRRHRIYFEEAGQGIPLLCLHTAGADGRQYRAVLNDAEITSRFRVIAFDLPWHGKSSPPVGYQQEVYKLTTDAYVNTVMAVANALGLDQPVVMGCSIGGRVVVHLALRHAAFFRAAIGLQSALYADDKTGNVEDGSRMVLHRPDVHGGKVAGALMNGVMAPQSPVAQRWETMWHYMQGGPGIFLGDLHYYFTDGDLRNAPLDRLAGNGCPLYLLSGEYDPSATPEMGAELAEKVGAAHFEVMREMGHFPMSENPELFREYLLPVLDRIVGGEQAAA
ncbi:MAG: alpha/beta hydrolase [Pseudomonadota bacterium]